LLHHIPSATDGLYSEYDHVPRSLARAAHKNPGLFRTTVYGTVAAIFESEHTMTDVAVQKGGAAATSAALNEALGRRSIVLVGMMGAGKSSIGRRLAARLGIPFVDADGEIETAASMTIPEIFATKGEPYFRAGEARVIARLLESGPQVLATGGGAFMNPETRAVIGAKGISIWLKATIDVLLRRIRRRADRPLLSGPNPAETLNELIAERYPVYAQADLTVESRDVPHDTIVAEIVARLCGHVGVVGEAEARET
jgi:shikimate kinase